MRQMMLANHNLHIHAKGIRRPPGTLDHAPLRRPSRGQGSRADLHIHRQAPPSSRTASARSGSSSCKSTSPLLLLRFFAQHPMRRLLRRTHHLRALRNQHRSATRRARHPLIQRRHIVPLQHRHNVPGTAPPPTTSVVKDSHHRRIPPRQHPRNPAAPPSIPPRRSLIHQNLIALHRTIQLIRRNKKIIVAIRASIRPHKSISIAMEIQLPRH